MPAIVWTMFAAGLAYVAGQVALHFTLKARYPELMLRYGDRWSFDVPSRATMRLVFEPRLTRSAKYAALRRDLTRQRVLGSIFAALFLSCCVYSVATGHGRAASAESCQRQQPAEAVTPAPTP